MTFSRKEFAALLGILTFSAILPTASWSATIRDDQPASGYLNLATQPDYAPVGSFINSWGYAGSATLIAPDWVLTAAHNLTAATFGTFTLNGNSYQSSQLISHPLWNGNAFNGYDLALVRLSSSVAGITPASLYTGAAEIGATGTFVGFGFTGTGLTGWQTLDNQKRAFQNVIDGNFGTPSVLLVSDFDNPNNAADNGFGDALPLSLEGAVAPGDSGGGVFLNFGAQSYLAGVISFVAAADGNANADYGDVSGFGRVSTFVPWIHSVVPEPSTAALVATTGVGLCLRRTRQKRK